MSRGDGFAVADISVALYDDDKVKRLYRELDGDLGRMGHAMMLCEATLLASWRDGRRRTVHEAAPIWLTVDADLVAILVKVGLLDRSLRRPMRSWNGWFGPALARKRARQEAGRIGGLRSGKVRGSKGEAIVPGNSSNAEPDRPSGRSVRTVRQDRSSRASAREASSNDAGRNGRLADLVTPEALAAIGKRP